MINNYTVLITFFSNYYPRYTFKSNPLRGFDSSPRQKRNGGRNLLMCIHILQLL